MYISVITLNINVLNSPFKRHKLAELVKKQNTVICFLKETYLDFKKIKICLTVKGWAWSLTKKTTTWLLENGGIFSAEELVVEISQNTKKNSERKTIQSQELYFITHYGENYPASR